MAASVLFVFAFFKGFGHVVFVFVAFLKPKISKHERVRRQSDAQNIARNQIDVAISDPPVQNRVGERVFRRSFARFRFSFDVCSHKEQRRRE